MIFTAVDTTCSFAVRWSECRAGARSLSHKGLMLMTDKEAYAFTQMQREKTPERQDGRWALRIEGMQP
jgi:hypothetical protein